MELRQIEIDVEVNRAIENGRSGFSESQNDILRKLLGIAPAVVARPTVVSSGRAWSAFDLTLPHGTKLRMVYNGKNHDGEIVDGAWIVEGKAYSSPSGAASGVARTKAGGQTRLDGWKYWSAKLPNSTDWILLWDLWERAKKAKKAKAAAG